MKQYVVLVLLACACSAAIFSLIGDKSYSHMQSLQRSVGSQREKNAQLERQVNDIKGRIRKIAYDDRELEKTVRNKFGLARPDETIVIFDKKQD